MIQTHLGQGSFTKRMFSFFYLGGSWRRRAVKYSWLRSVLKIRLISTPSLFLSSAFLLSLSKEQHKHVIHLSLSLGWNIRPASSLILLDFNSCSSVHKSIDWTSCWWNIAAVELISWNSASKRIINTALRFQKGIQLGQHSVLRTLNLLFQSCRLHRLFVSPSFHVDLCWLQVRWSGVSVSSVSLC